MVDPESHVVIGLQIEGVVAGFLHEYPEYLELGRMAGVPEPALRQIEQDIGSDRIRSRSVLLLLEHLRLSQDIAS